MMRRSLICLLAALCLLLCACGAPRAKADSISLWYAEDDPAAAALCALAADYNRTADKELLRISLRALPDGESLAAAAGAGSLPELLLCSHDLALTLQEQGLLRDMRAALGDAAPAYPADLAPHDEGLGRSVFPLGAAVQLLCRREDEPAPADLEALFRRAADYGRETGLPYCTADAFAPLFYQLLLLRDTEFQALRERDLRSPAYPEVYNLLAGAAYDHGLCVSDAAGARLVQSGQLPCALVDAPRLPGLALSGCVLTPLPGIGEGGPYLADLRCLAVTAREGRAGRSLGAFLAWLLEDARLQDLALQSGLVPVHSGAPVAEDSPLNALLCGMGTRYRLFLADDSRSYLENRAAFEADFRAALARLG